MYRDGKCDLAIQSSARLILSDLQADKVPTVATKLERKMPARRFSSLKSITQIPPRRSVTFPVTSTGPNWRVNLPN